MAPALGVAVALSRTQPLRAADRKLTGVLLILGGLYFVYSMMR
jgi:hypothetical protein